MKNNYKVYGNEKTNLTLTPMAQKFYNLTDPLEIREFSATDEDSDTTYTYDILGAIESSALDDDGVNRTLLSAYFDVVSNEIHRNYYCQWRIDTGLYDADPEPETYMTLDIAKNDLEQFSKDGWEMPEDMTAEDYMEAVNLFVDDYHIQNELKEYEYNIL